ncbi:MAG: tRNA pseudouridine(38-40) synthase TruA [Ignavibacteriae bacterium]|nr:tRNA pseudouridine(38-40) synthase TruA [Ignavibacteriota bacterium]
MNPHRKQQTSNHSSNRKSPSPESGSESRRFKLYIEYEGTRYSGWQVQKNARTVQGELIGAMRKVFKTDDFELYGAGRTDAGVHALEQIAHLDLKTMLGPEIIRMKVNDELPADVNLIEVEKTHANFHARHDATARSYLYQISRRRTALGKRYVWWIKDKLDVRKMEATLNLFVGMNDMRSFTDDDPEAKSTKVLIDRVEIRESGALILIRLVGSHFVWKLVRRVVGVTAEVGRGKLSLDDVRRFLSQQSPEPARLTAPPSGLFLERIYYKGDKPTAELRPVLHI